MTDSQRAAHTARMKKRREAKKDEIAAYMRDYAKKNKERIAANQRRWKKENRDYLNRYSVERSRRNKQRVAEVKQASYRRHSAKRTQKSRERYWADAEASRKYFRDRYAANIEHNRANARVQALNRRAALSEIPKMTEGIIQRLEDLQQGACWFCGSDIRGGYHVDHFMPICRGGTNADDNLSLLCPRCNHSKNGKLPEVFFAQAGLTPRLPPLASPR